MKLLGRLSLPWLIVGFIVGLVATWLVQPKRRVVVEFPSPYNAGTITYTATDGGGDNRCFQYRADPTTCPDDGKGVTLQPIRRDDLESFLICPAAQDMFLQDGVDLLSPDPVRSPDRRTVQANHAMIDA